MIFVPVVYEGRKFERLRRFNESAVFSGVTLRDCEFHSCDLAQWVDPAYPIRVSDVRVVGCNFFGNSVVGVQFEDVVVDGCVTGDDGLTLRGCLFRHVTLRGKVGDWIVNDLHRDLSESEHAAFLTAATKFYSGVDWVLDISDAAFESAAFFSLPGDLIRRDPETQFLVRKERLVGVDMSSFSRVMRLRLKRVQRNAYDSTVLVVGRENERFGEELSEHRKLIDLGIADA